MTKKNENFEEILGVKKKVLVSSLNDVHKMAWEQVLLLAIYARQVCFFQDPDFKKNGVLPRVNLIGLAIEAIETLKGGEELLPNLLNWLEDGDGTNAIISRLQKLETSSDYSHVESALLRKIEENNIAFSPTDKNIHYSYFAIYRIVYRPITAFQNLLSLSWEIENFDNLLAEILYSFMSAKGILPHPISDQDKSRPDEDINSLLNYIEEKSISFDKEDLCLFLKTKLAERVGSILKESFYEVSYRPKQPDYEEVQQDAFARLFQKESNNKDFTTIKIDNNLFEYLKSLGQMDSVMDSLKRCLLEPSVNKPSRGWYNLNMDENHVRAFHEVGSWYESKKTPLFTKTDQIPKLIASILEFDIRYNIGYFKILEHYKKTAKDIYKLTTSIVRESLYYGSDFSHLYCNRLIIRDIDALVEDFEKRSQSERQESPVSVQLLEKWANKDEKAMMERFKKLPPYLKENRYISISSFIEKQIKAEEKQTIAYPLSPLFPLPLWFYNHHSTWKDETEEKEGELKS